MPKADLMAFCRLGRTDEEVCDLFQLYFAWVLNHSMSEGPVVHFFGEHARELKGHHDDQKSSERVTWVLY